MNKVRQTISILIFAFGLSLSAADNLILNGDMGNEAKFDQECRSDGDETGKLTLFAEDLTWNKCGRLEVVGTKKSAAGTDEINANAWIGLNAEGRLPGFFVKPNATYEFSIDLRGTPERVRVAAKTWSQDSLTAGSELRLTTVSMTKIGREWQTFRGTFKTGPKDVRAALCVQMWSDAQYKGSQQYKVGDWVLFDNVSVRDRQGDIEGFARKYGKPFAVAPVPVTADFRVPFVPSEVMDPPEKLVVRAAVNEIKALPLALANLTGEFAEYRVTLESTRPEDALTKYDGKFGLGGFPADQITVRKALRVKENDLYANKLRLDPLVKMDEASTIGVLAMEAGLVWIDFDTRGVKPGKYRGRLRIISLGEVGMVKRVKGGDYGDLEFACPGMREVPLELEVMPITLDPEPMAPLSLFATAETESLLDAQLVLGTREFLLSPWALAFGRDKNGEFDAKQYRPQKWIGGNADEVIAQAKKWAADRGVRPRFLIAYSCWNTYCSFHGAKDSPEARLKGWVSWLKAVRAYLNAWGIGDDAYVLEIEDEVKRERLDEIISALAEAKKVVPEVRFTNTFLGGKKPLTIEELERFRPYLDAYIFHDYAFLRNPGYRDYVRELVKSGKAVSHYTCSTRMNEDLDREFRQNAWMSLRYGLSGSALYQGIDMQGGFGARNWKVTTYGGILYRSDDAVLPSVRALALRQGVEDVKYAQLLLRLGKADARIAEFVAKCAEKVTENPAGGDRTLADRVRDKIAERILKMQ